MEWASIPVSDDEDPAVVDAEQAIRYLPCDGCGGIHWPALHKPKWGTIEWWDDPGAFFACRTCGRYLASAFAYPYIRQANDRYPLEGVVPSREESEADVSNGSSGLGGRSGIRVVRNLRAPATDPS